MHFRKLSLASVVTIIVLITAIFISNVVAQTTDPQSDSTIQFVGAVEGMTANTITVNQQFIDITVAEINVGLEAGVVVQVEASVNEGGFLVAQRVNPAAAGAVPGELEIIGTVETFDGATLVVNGQSFDVSAATVGADVAVGQLVAVHASANGQGGWIARDAAVTTATAPAAGTFTVAGTLQSIGSGTITVSGQPINIASAQVPNILLLGTWVRAQVQGPAGQLTALTVESGAASAGFSTSGDDNTNTNANTNGNANTNDNGNTNTNGNANTNTNGNTNTNTNDNSNTNGNTNDNTSPAPAITAQQAIDIVLAVYPTTAIRSIELTTRFGNTLVWEVKISNRITVIVDAMTGVILTIDRPGDDDNSNTNGNTNDNSNDNSDDNGGNGGGNDGNGNTNTNTNDNGDDGGGNGNGNGNDNGGGNNNDNDDDGGGNDNGGDDDDDDGGGNDNGNDNGGGGDDDDD